MRRYGQQLLAKVEALLQAHEDDGGFLDEPLSQVGEYRSSVFIQATWNVPLLYFSTQL
jgi:hypothetical protein